MPILINTMVGVATVDPRRSIVRAARERTRERYAEVRREMETGLRAIVDAYVALPKTIRNASPSCHCVCVGCNV